MRAVQYLPDGVVLAVVDPGVGTDRRCIAVEVENGVLVGPDNGLLAPAVAMLGGPRRVVALDNAPSTSSPRPGPTFAGRDIMAPAAAYLAGGRPDRRRSGPRSTPRRSRPALVPLPDEDDDGTHRGEVLWVDRFGNCQLNVAPEQLDGRGRAARRRARGQSVTDAAGERPCAVPAGSRTFADAKPSELVAARRLLRHVRARARPAVGRGRARSCARRARSRWPPNGRRRDQRPTRGVPIGLGAGAPA